MNCLLRLTFALTFCIITGSLSRAHGQSIPPRVSVVGQTAGPTPFIVDLTLSTPDFASLKSVKFAILPKSGSVTRPISAVYYADYLEARGFLDRQFVKTTLPIFGLYSDYANTVQLTYRFNDGTAETETVTVTTGFFDDVYGYGSPTVVQARTNDTSLSYDYLMLKDNQGTQSPIVIDTDGAIRWVGTSGEVYLSTIFYNNSFFIPYTPANSSSQTGIAEMDLDGSYRFIKDYSPDGITGTFHHNYDKGRDGILMEVSTHAQLEAVILEVNTSGTILHIWDMAAIISDAMKAGGDDPSQFVYTTQTDWFHNNANTYRASDNTLIVSSRENFVIALDYDTHAIKWILGDPTKKWYQFPSLRKYALALAPGSLPPIGQHAVSITHDDHLLLFDNGMNSNFQMPAGAVRPYSSPRKYEIDTTAMLATEVWNYEQNQGVEVKFTGSVYEDDPSNYYIDYASVYVDEKPYAADLVGLNTAGEKVFDYRYLGSTIGVFAWNSIPVHFENLVFTGPQTALDAEHHVFFTGEVALDNGVHYLAFPANGNVFGYYSYLTDPHYIYHFGLGYEYVFNAADRARGIYLYDFASGDFFYTSPEFPFPYLYDFTLGAVLYYFADADPTGANRYFYNFATGKVITR